MKNKKMPKKEVKKQLVEVLTVLLMIIWTLGFVFGVVSLGRSCKKDSVTASAYTQTQVDSRELYVLRLPSNLYFYLQNGDSQSVEEYLSDNSLFMLVFQVGSFAYSLPVYIADSYGDYNASPSGSILATYNDISQALITNRAFYFYMYEDYISLVDITCYVSLYSPSLPNANGSSLVFTTMIDPEYNPIVLYRNVENDFFQDGYDSGYIDGETYGYDRGLYDGGSTGYQEGYDIGKREGLAEGRQLGFADGEAQGYEDGVAAAGTYTFNKFFSAIIDVPIQAFQGLFNFEFLGINLANFFLSLLTVAIILAVIRFVL